MYDGPSRKSWEYLRIVSSIFFLQILGWNEPKLGRIGISVYSSLCMHAGIPYLYLS